ncbi:MAG: pilin [Parcubacteria group bacterium]
MKKLKIILVITILALSLQVFIPSTLAQDNKSLEFTPQVPIPGSEFSEAPIPVGEYNDEATKIFSTLLPRYIKAIYEYGIGVAAFLALAMIVAGGLIWLTSGGATDKVSTAKSMISSSIIGLVLLLGTYTVAEIINPSLLNFKPIETIYIGAEQYSKDIDGCCSFSHGDVKSAFETNEEHCESKDEDKYTFYPGWYAVDSEEGNYKICAPKSAKQEVTRGCDNCELLDVPCKPGANCFADMSLAEKLENAYGDVSTWRVTEAFPPTYKHQAECHYNGTCVDANIINKEATPENIKAIHDALKRQGLRPVYERKSGCAAYRDLGVECIELDAITAPHFSVYLH